MFSERSIPRWSWRTLVCLMRSFRLAVVMASHEPFAVCLPVRSCTAIASPLQMRVTAISLFEEGYQGDTALEVPMFNIELEVAKSGLKDKLEAAISCGEIRPEDIVDFFTNTFIGTVRKPKKFTATEVDTFPDFDVLDRNGTKDKSNALLKIPTTVEETFELFSTLDGIPGCDIMSGEEVREVL